MFPKVRILLFQLICYVEAVSSIPVSNSVLFFFDGYIRFIEWIVVVVDLFSH